MAEPFDFFRRTDSIVPGCDIAPVSASALKILKQRYNDAAMKLKRLYNLYAGSGDEVLLETIEDIKSELESVSRQIADEEKNHSIASDITERLNSVVNLREQWDRLSMKERQQAVAVCISRIVIDGTDIDIHYRF